MITKEFKIQYINKIKERYNDCLIPEEIADRVKYVAVDANGQVYGYSEIPYIENTIFGEGWNLNKCESKTTYTTWLFHIDIDSSNWKDTLVKIEDIDEF